MKTPKMSMPNLQSIIGAVDVTEKPCGSIVTISGGQIVNIVSAKPSFWGGIGGHLEPSNSLVMPKIRKLKEERGRRC